MSNERENKPGEYGLQEAKLYNKLKTMFEGGMMSVAGVDGAERTREVPSEKVDHQVIEHLNKIAGEYLKTYPPINMTDIARTIQAVQACY